MHNPNCFCQTFCLGRRLLLDATSARLRAIAPSYKLPVQWCPYINSDFSKMSPKRTRTISQIWNITRKLGPHGGPMIKVVRVWSSCGAIRVLARRAEGDDHFVLPIKNENQPPAPHSCCSSRTCQLHRWNCPFCNGTRCSTRVWRFDAQKWLIERHYCRQTAHTSALRKLPKSIYMNGESSIMSTEQNLGIPLRRSAFRRTKHRRCTEAENRLSCKPATICLTHIYAEIHVFPNIELKRQCLRNSKQAM